MKKGALSLEEIEHELARNNVEVHVIEDGYVELELRELLVDFPAYLHPGRMARLGMAFAMIGEILIESSEQCVSEEHPYEVDDGVEFAYVAENAWYAVNEKAVKQHHPIGLVSTNRHLYYRKVRDAFVKIDPPA